MSSPSSSTRPESGAIKPPTTYSSVLLPAPLGPIIPVMRRESATNSASRSAAMPPNALVTPVTLNTIPSRSSRAVVFVRLRSFFRRVLKVQTDTARSAVPACLGKFGLSIYRSCFTSLRRLCRHQVFLLANKVGENLSCAAQCEIGLQEDFAISLLGSLEHMMLLLARPFVFRGDGGEHLSDPFGRGLVRIAVRHVVRRRIHQHAPDVAVFIDRRVGVNEYISALVLFDPQTAGIFPLAFPLIELAGRLVAHHDAGNRRAHHAMRVMTIDDGIVKPVDVVRRLLVILRFPDGHHVFISIYLAFFEFDRNRAVGEVADVAVVQRVEMRDVEKIFDQKQVIRRHFHRADLDAFPFRVIAFGKPRWLPLFRQREIARPDPDEAVLFDHGEADHLRLRRNWPGGVRGNHYAFSRRVVTQPVIRAFQRTVGHQAAFRQRKALVRAAIVVSDNIAVFRTPDHHRTLCDHLPRQLLLRKVRGEPGHVPSVTDDSSRYHFSLPFRRKFDFAFIVYGSSTKSGLFDRAQHTMT